MHRALDASLPTSSYFERARLGELVMRRAGLLLFITALGLRLWGLDAHGLWYDETISVETAQHGLDAIFNQRFGWVGNQTPLHYLIVWLTIQPVDPTITTLLVRLPSALAGALLVVLTYALGRTMFGNWQGLLAGTLVALSTTALDYSQDLRPYSLATALLVLAVYCLVKIGQPSAGAQPSRAWWAFFALSLAGAMYTSYALSIMAFPSLALCCVWAWWRWHTVVAGKGMLLRLWPALMLAVLGACLVPAALDLLKIPGAPFNLGLLTPLAVSSEIFNVWTWFTRFGLPSNIEVLARTTMLLLMGVGIYGGIRAVRAGRSPRFGLWICALFVFFPVLELVVYSVSRPGLPRYILFILPFYYLLLANGAHALSSVLSTLVARMSRAGARANLSGIAMPRHRLPLAHTFVATLLTLLFALGYYHYSTPGGYSTLAPFRFDFRDAYALLGTVARTEDTIIVANDPQHGETVADLYWRGSPPAPTYNVLDPRLPARSGGGALYWVIADWDINKLGPALASDSRWQVVYDNSRVLVLKEATHAAANLSASIEYMAGRLTDILPAGRLTYALRGMAYEARGDLQKAAEEYGKAGRSIRPNLGKEFMNTALGFEAGGDLHRSWRDALASKLEDGANPQLYSWLARRLDTEGYTALARQQEELARLLVGGY
jgi:4-amino-4-deoxy-L-arabinose transferase-like glycosyltransferase